jgi:hypothetical protein
VPEIIGRRVSPTESFACADDDSGDNRQRLDYGLLELASYESPFVSTLDFAVWKCLLKLLDALVGDFGLGKAQVHQLLQPFEVL